MGDVGARTVSGSPDGLRADEVSLGSLPTEHAPPDDAATAGAAAAAAADDPWTTFDRWASWFCLGLALLTGLVGLLAIGPGMAGELDPVLAGLTIAVVAGQAALLYAVSAGLSLGRTWARPAVFWVLLLAVVSGFAGALVDFTHGRLTMPLAAILGVVILARAPGRVRADTPGDARRAALVGLALLLLTVLPGVVALAATEAPLSAAGAAAATER